MGGKSGVFGNPKGGCSFIHTQQPRRIASFINAQRPCLNNARDIAMSWQAAQSQDSTDRSALSVSPGLGFGLEFHGTAQTSQHSGLRDGKRNFSGVLQPSFQENPPCCEYWGVYWQRNPDCYGEHVISRLDNCSLCKVWQGGLAGPGLKDCLWK